jgi:hypothetical protein
MLHLILSLANWTAFGLVVLSQFQAARAVKGTRPRYLWSTALRISSYLLIVVWLATASVSIATGNFIHAALALGMGCFWMWVESSREKDDDMFTGMGTKILNSVKQMAAAPAAQGSGA